MVLLFRVFFLFLPGLPSKRTLINLFRQDKLFTVDRKFVFTSKTKEI